MKKNTWDKEKIIHLIKGYSIQIFYQVMQNLALEVIMKIIDKV